MNIKIYLRNITIYKTLRTVLKYSIVIERPVFKSILGSHSNILLAFVIHGYKKFPLPPQNLIEYFNFSPFLANFVAISELSAGILLIIGGFIKDYLGSLITRFGALNIVIIMLFALGLAHRDWLITPKLFMSEQIFLLLIGLYFLIRGNK